MDRCKFCGGSVTVNNLGSSDTEEITCPRCGYYRLTRTASACTTTFPRTDLLLFSGYLRNNSSQQNPITVSSSDLSEIESVVALLRRLTVPERINLVIRHIGDRSRYLGDGVRIDKDSEYTRFFCVESEEITRIHNYLMAEGIVSNETYSDWKLTVKGWQKYDSLKEINIESKKVFVAMSFATELKHIFDQGILPACEECGYKAFRVDSKEHIEKVCDKIIGDIKESRFVVADFTQNKHGVYFEAGFAMGLGLKVIWSCKDDEGEKKNLHFDTRQYNHIFWKDSEDLKRQLTEKIRAVIK